LHILEVTDFFSIDSGDKDLRDINQGNKLALLLVHPLLWKHADKEFANCKKKMWRNTINELQSADPHLAAALEGLFIENRGKQPQSEVMEENRITEFCLLQSLH
jgi:hypothetical protein